MSAASYLARLRLPDGRLWVDAAYPFQLADARAVLDESAPPYSYLTRSRGSSKTSDLAGIALAMLLAADHPARFYWCAADAGQGALALDAIAAYLRDSGISGAAEVQSRRVIVADTDARLDVLPADEPGAWGLNPDAVFCDELSNWSDTLSPRRLWEAVSSAVAKRSDARLVVLTTAGSPDHFSRKVLDAALASPLWRVNEVRGPAPWADPERIAEQRQRLPEAVFRQLFQNEWVAAADSFVDPAVIEAAFVEDGPTLQRAAGRVYCAGLDLGAVADRTAFAICHREGEAVILDRLQTWQGTRARPVDFGEVEGFIVAAHQRFGFRLRLDPWQGLDLARRLRTQGIAAEEFPFSQGSKQRLAATLLQTLNAGSLRLYPAEGLREELLGLRLRQSASGAWSFDHRSGGHDDRVMALALALVAALEGCVGHPPVAVRLEDLGRRAPRSPDSGRVIGSPWEGAWENGW